MFKFAYLFVELPVCFQGERFFFIMFVPTQVRVRTTPNLKVRDYVAKKPFLVDLHHRHHGPHETPIGVISLQFNFGIV